MLIGKFDHPQLIEDIGKAAARFEGNFPLQSFQAAEYKQHPAVTLLTCSDSRMPVEIFGASFNRIFAVENIGNQYRTGEGSVLYGLLHLHTPLMIVAGHTDCGAITAAKSDFLDEPLALRNELSVVRDSLDRILPHSGAQPTDDKGLYLAKLAELNVDLQIDLLMENDSVFNLVEDSQLMVIGVIVDLHNVYKEGYGRVYTINVNGEINSEILQSFTSLGFFAAQAKRITCY